MKKIFTLCLLAFIGTTQVNAQCTPTTSTTNATICAGSSYNFNGTSYNAAGTYVAHLTNAGGCDSAATLNLNMIAGSG